MAFYHLSAKVIGRSTGRSSIAAAAYRSGSRLTDERTGKEHDYTRKNGVEHSEILAPQNSPDWMRDRAALWNAVERVEKRRDAQLAREIELGLPREISAHRRADVVRGFVQAEFVEQGMIADFAVHNGRARDGGEQPHAHVMLTTRELMGEGFGKKNRDWNGTDKLEGWRARWAEHVNRELEHEGHEVRVDHRRLDVQRREAERIALQARTIGDEQTAARHEVRAAALDREPEPKLGPIASQMEKLGYASRRGDERRAVEARNAERRTLHEQARKVAQHITEVAQQLAEDARRRLQDVAQRLETAYRTAYRRAETALARPDAVQIGNAKAREALLGRLNRPTTEPDKAVDKNALLGRNPSACSDQISRTTGEALLGRGETKRERERGDGSSDLSR